MRRRSGKRAAGLCCACLVLLLSGCTMPFGGDTTAYDAGLELLEARDYHGALDQLRTAVDGGERSADTYRAKGIAEYSLGDFASAEASFIEALDRCGGVPDARAVDIACYLAQTYVDQGLDDKAVEVYTAILDLNRSNEDAHFLRGLCYLRMGEREKADEDFERILSRKPLQYDRVLAIYQGMNDAGYATEGRQMLDTILTENAESMSSYEKGRFYYSLGNNEEARRYLEEANNETSEERADVRIPIVILLGEVAQDLGDDSYAISVYRRFLQDDQSQASIYNALGVCEMRMGSYSDALTDFQIGRGLDDPQQNAALIRNMVAAYEYMGNYETAAQMMQEYLTLVPNDEEAIRENVFLSSRVAEEITEEEKE